MSIEIRGKRFKVEDIERPAIVGWGRYSPMRYITNSELIAKYEQNITDEQIEKKTGIRTRAEEPEGPTSSLEISASFKAITKAGLSPTNIDLILENSSSPDRLIPGNGSIIQRAIGAKNAFVSSHNDACVGGLVLMRDGCNLVRLGEAKNVLAVTGEKYPAIIDPTDPDQWYFFGSGGAALVISNVRLARRDLKLLYPEFYFHSDPSTLEDTYIKAGGSADPITEEALRENEHKLTMNGRKALLEGIEGIPRNVREVLKKAGLRIKDIDVFFPQGNLRMVEKVVKELKIPSENVFTIIRQEGYLGCVTIPATIAEADALGILKPGMVICGATAPDSGGKSGAFLMEWEGITKHPKPWWKKAQILAKLAARALHRNYYFIPFQLP